jgi:hypothetical protein
LINTLGRASDRSRLYDWFYVSPLNIHSLFLKLFSQLTALGFWIGIYKIWMIAQVALGKGAPQIGVMLIRILSFFLYTAL